MKAPNFDLTKLTASEMAEKVRNKKLSPEDVVRAHLDQIKKIDGKIGAFQTVRAAAALADARKLSKRPDLYKLALAGVPVAIKDDVDVAGEPTRYGSAATSDKPASQDDELVKRLRAAGCIVIGKTKMPELAIWPFTESPVFGQTRNPWDVSRTAGGSSGGSAAAVSSHMAPIALASDGGGSIRVPAACCGIVGIKPSPQTVPKPKGLGNHWMGMTEFGPLARTVHDLSLVLAVLSDTEISSSTTRKKLKIAVSAKSPTPGAKVNKEVNRAITQLAELLAQTGHQIVYDNPPYPKSLGWRFGSRWLGGISADAASLDLDKLEPRTRAMAKAGRWIGKHGLTKPASSDTLGKQMTHWFKDADYDLLLTATLTKPAVKIGQWQGKGWIATTLGVGNWLMTSPWSLAQFPAASIPAGQSKDGLPIGAQLVAAPGNEATILSLMAQIEQLQPWPAV